ncbi:MAG: ribosome small subunit-dependent GTPase A [Planctomycetota bacterium]
MIQGTVIRVDARGCVVFAEGEELFCRVRGRFYEDIEGQKRPIAPGDRVSISRTSEGEGAVEEIEPRRTRLSRQAAHGEREQVIAANVDQVAIIVSVKNPPLRPGLIDRLIIAASNQAIEPFVVINKIDLGIAKKVGKVRDTFRELGYEVLYTSATEGTGVPHLALRLADRTTVFAGHSGVGKSSLLNAIHPELHLATGSVSKRTTKGRHTTTRATLFPLPAGGYVVDTPGVRAFGLWDVEKADLDIFFREFQPLIEQCRFYDCTHDHEPDCAVRAAVEAGEVRRPRYDAYLRIMRSLEGEQR